MLRQQVKSASRTLEVLDLFAAERRPLRLNEIYTTLGYPQSSTTNLLKSMVLDGYLNYNRRSRTYLPTPRVSALGSWLPNYIHSDQRYRLLIDKLQLRTDETVALATQNDLFIQYIFLKTPDHEFKMAPPEGTMRLMADSSSGFALMCALPNKEVDKICRYTNYYQMSEGHRIQYEDVMIEVERARKFGYAYYNNMPTSAVSSISIPLDEDLHGIPLAIGVGGLHERISHAKEDIIRSMRDCIAEFKALALGPSPEEEAA